MRARLAVLVVAGLIAVLGVTAITASGAGHETEVRVTAQRLADGRTEFALQQREADDEWGERLLPRARFFPATATVGRWLSSTPLTVRAPGAGDDAEGAEVRITAQRLADDRIEFALQEREADGQWGERLLTRARFFPATATVGRWLVSTPLTVSLPEPAASPDTAEDGGSVASDRAALVALYNATEGASWWTSTNWLSDRPLDEWHGVTTNSDGRVAGLDLSLNLLTGPLPAELGGLTNLELLDVWGNQLMGPIPAELGGLRKLVSLYLDNNELTGPIPAWLGDLTNLQVLWLSGNELTGCVPFGLQDAWPNALLALDLPDCGEDRAALVAFYEATDGTNWTHDWNWLSDRPLDEWHGVTTNSDGRVAELWLLSNELTGPIPAALGDLTNLELLDLWGNELTGPIPAELGDLSNLHTLSLAFNELTGPIPAELGDLSNLERLDLRFNELTGPIPAALGDLTNLERLILWDNRLTGPIPAELGDLFNLEALVLRSNELTGPIPAELGDLTNLESLDLQSNQLTGPIPAELGGLSNLVRLYLENNELTGPIPAELGDLANLARLDLSGNQLTGPIPAELGNLTNLIRLILGLNELTGLIPAWLGDLTNLTRLSLSGNGLRGPIPAELGGLTNL